MSFDDHLKYAYDEIRASRELAREIQQVMEQFGEGVIPVNVLQAYKRLYGVYIKQMQSEGL